DVDGDGYLDALTDTATATLSTPAGSTTPQAVAPYWHALSLRSTVANSDGTISPFSRVRPGTIDRSTEPGKYLPAAGQYYANLKMQPSGAPDTLMRMFGY